MQVAPATNLACPIDGLPLAMSGRALACPTGHSYDQAREGYWNLLLVQHKASRDPGDSKDMVAARRRVLEAGHYAPIADALFAMLQTTIAAAGENGEAVVVDAGCGEGYYLDRIARLAARSGRPGQLRLAGFDVSKWAVQAAARRKGPVTWLVANSAHPPFAPASVDVVLCIFGFPVWDGFVRVLQRSGAILLVDPAPDHLIELRSIIYPTVTRTEPQALTRAEVEGLRPAESLPLRYQIELSGRGLIRDLIEMTPHAHRARPAGMSGLAGIETITVTIDVVLRLLRRP